MEIDKNKIRASRRSVSIFFASSLFLVTGLIYKSLFAKKGNDAKPISIISASEIKTKTKRRFFLMYLVLNFSVILNLVQNLIPIYIINHFNQNFYKLPRI